MSEQNQVHKSHAKEYIFIFVILAALTIIEVVIPGMESLSYFMKASSLTFLAVGKGLPRGLLLYAPQRRDGLA